MVKITIVINKTINIKLTLKFLKSSGNYFENLIIKYPSLSTYLLYNCFKLMLFLSNILLFPIPYYT